MLSRQPYIFEGNSNRRSGGGSSKRSTKVKTWKKGERKMVKEEIKSALRENVELKYFALADNTYGAISNNGTDFLQSVTNVPQGDTDSTRDGDRIQMQELRFRVGIKTGSATPTFLRIICFQWKPNTTPVYASILLDQHGTSNAPISDFQHDSRDMYKILSDDLVQVDSSAHTATCVERSIKKGFNHHVQYTAGSTTVGTNQLYIMAVSDVATNGPSVVLQSKLLYTDA